MSEQEEGKMGDVLTEEQVQDELNYLRHGGPSLVGLMRSVERLCDHSTALRSQLAAVTVERDKKEAARLSLSESYSALIGENISIRDKLRDTEHEWAASVRRTTAIEARATAAEEALAKAAGVLRKVMKWEVMVPADGASYRFTVVEDSVPAELRLQADCIMNVVLSRSPSAAIPCRTCGKPVEDARKCYAIPTCYACLPPPDPLPVCRPHRTPGSPSAATGCKECERLAGLLLRCVQAMEAWGAQEDGIPASGLGRGINAFAAYTEARSALASPAPTATKDGEYRRGVEDAIKTVNSVEFPDDQSHNLLIRAFKECFTTALRALLDGKGGGR